MSEDMTGENLAPSLKRETSPVSADFKHFVRKIASAATRRGVAGALILSAVLTACQDASAATPVPPDGERSTVTATIAPTETARPTETATATETLPNYELCTNWREAAAGGCPVPWEDIKKGVPGDIARLHGEAFPDTAYNTGRIYLISREEGMPGELSWFFWEGSEDKDYRSKPETRPYRWVGFFSVIDDQGRSYLGAVQQWLNPSGRISYLTYINFPAATEDANRVWQEEMAVGWPEVKTGSLDSYFCGGEDSYKCEALFDEETNSLIRTWAETGEIPAALEKKVLASLVALSPVLIPLTP